MAKRNIKVTPQSTADKKKQKNKPGGKGNSKRQPPPGQTPTQPGEPTDPTQLAKWDAYQRAIADGRERKFLKQNPGFRKKANIPMPPKPGYKAFNKDDAKLSQIINKGQIINAENNRAATLGQNVGSTETAFGEAGGYIGPDGRYHTYSTESDPQSQIRQGGESLSIGGIAAAQKNLDNYQAFDWQGSPEERARIEESVYGKLTRNVDRDYGQEFNEMEQRMYNRGIPLDPSNPAYKREMDALNEKYSAIKENARGQAVQLGGEEMQRSYQQGLGGQQQRMAETAALQKFGMGYQGAPQVGFNASDFNQIDPSALWSDTRGQNQQYKVGMENAKANMMSAQAAMMNAQKAGEGGEEESPV